MKIFVLETPNGGGLSRHLSLGIAIVVAMLLYLLVISMPDFLPRKYLYDSENLLNVVRFGGSFIMGGDSFENTGVFFRMLGLGADSIPTASFVIVLSSLHMALRKSRIVRLPFWFSILIAIWSIIMMVYIGQASKELVVTAMVLAFLFMAGSKAGLRTWLFLAMLYALYFRLYWLMVCALFCSTYLFGFMLSRRIHWIIFGMVVYGTMAIVFKHMFGEPLTLMRDLLNFSREQDPDSLTAITYLIPGDGLLSGWLNAMLATLMIVFPVMLLKLGQPQHVAAFFIIPLTLWLCQYASHELHRQRRHTLQTRAAARWLYCFVLIQGLFEPDYGSFLKHLAPLAPLMFFLIAAAIPGFKAKSVAPTGAARVAIS